MAVNLLDVGSGFKRTAINSNFTTIESELNDNVLTKDGGTQLEADLDFNSNKAINIADGVNNKDAVNLGQVNGIISAASSGLIASQQETQKGSEASGQVFTFTGITYTVGGNNLYVFHNGVKLTKGRDYTETSSSSITMVSGYTINANDDFDFITNIATTSSVSDTSAITHTEGSTTHNLAAYLQSRNEAYLENYQADITTDISATLVSLVVAGYKKIYLPESLTLKCDEITMTAAWAGVEIIGAGSGLAYAGNTMLIPNSPTQNYMFHAPTGVGGIDDVRFKGIRFDGQDTLKRAVNQISGAGWWFEDIQAEKCTEYALYCEQGLNRYERIYIDANLTSGDGTGGIAMYSDFIADGVEVTGGEYGVRIMAGGGRLANALVNSASEACIILEPLDGSTNHINTALSNIYTGETYNAAEKPIIKIKGNATSRVRDVQMSNIHTVSAAAAGVKHNVHIDVEAAERINITSWCAFGIDAFETANLYDAGGLHCNDVDDITVDASTIYGISKAPIKVTDTSISIGSSVRFINWGGAYATGNDIAAVQATDSGSWVSIADGVTFKSERVSANLAGFSPSGINWKIGQVNERVVGTTSDSIFSFTVTPAAYVDMPYGIDGLRYNYGGTTTFTGTVATPGGGGLVNLYTIPSTISEDHNYIVTVQQQGTGANATVGYVFAKDNLVGSCTTGNTQTGTLANTISNTGTTIEFTAGTGYGATTWVYSIARQF